MSGNTPVTLHRGGVQRLAPTEAPQIRITGRLAADAQFRLSTGPRPYGQLTLLIGQPDDLPVRCTQITGGSEAAITAAKAKAASLPRGTLVTVYGRALVQHTNRDLLELAGVHDVTFTPPTPRQCRDA